MTPPIRVMIVDDSAVVRGLIARWVDDAPDIEITGFAGDGGQALKQLSKADPDIVLLDIEMPVLDGLSILPRIREAQPDARIIMVSSLTVRHARETFRALTMGATDYLAKPSANGKAMTASGFQAELLEKIRVLAPGRERPISSRQVKPDPAPGQIHAHPLPKALPFSTAPEPGIIVIGGSTGGPQALFTLFENGFPLAARLPVLITQHMPPTFTAIFAKHLESVSGLPAAEGQEGEIPVPGQIYVAPGGLHMSLHKEGGIARLHLDDGPAVNFCRPAVDRLFVSAAETCGPATFAIVLTGMGEDGCNGARQICEAGGQVVIQDEASSVVWGMPGAIAEAGLESGQFPIRTMGRNIDAMLARQGLAKTPLQAARGITR